MSKKSLEKTKNCHYLPQGKCVKGKNCPFIHDPEIMKINKLCGRVNWLTKKFDRLMSLSNLSKYDKCELFQDATNIMYLLKLMDEERKWGFKSTLSMKMYLIHKASALSVYNRIPFHWSKYSVEGHNESEDDYDEEENENYTIFNNDESIFYVHKKTKT